MLKLKKGQSKYEIIGQITFDNGGVEQTNYTIVIDGVTTTIESTDTQWEVIEVPDPEPVVEPELEPTPEPEPEPLVTPEPTPEEIARAEAAAIEAAAIEAAHEAKQTWLQKRAALDKMIDEMKQGREIGLDPTEADLALMRSLGEWINANRKFDYYF